MSEFWTSFLISSITGGFAGAVLTILYNYVMAKQSSVAKEKSKISSLTGELRRNILLCEHNSELRQNPTAPFIRFTNLVSTEVTFGKRYAYPHLANIQSKLEFYTLALSQVNQFIDLHNQLWSSTEQASSTTIGASGRREELRFQITDICSGKAKIKGVGPEGFIVLPPFIKDVSKQVEEIALKLSI
jgi:hypothetical protein